VSGAKVGGASHSDHALSGFSKVWPGYISNDHEMDLYLYQSKKNVTWIPNIRGASASLKLNNITSTPAAGALLVDFDRDTREDILQLTLDRKKIIINQKQSSFHKVIWIQKTLIDVSKLLEMPNLLFPVAAPTVSEPLDFRISSFIVDDFNNDAMPDLIIGIDVFSA
jgi:hypothetical protein